MIALLLFGLDSCAVQHKHAASRSQLEAYKAQHYAAVPQIAMGSASWKDYERELSQQRLVIAGDVHDDPALHRRLIELLAHSIAAAKREGRSLRLFVEFVGLEDEATLREYLQGTRSLDSLRKALQRRWPASWLDAKQIDAGFYLTLLELAKQAQIEVRALEAIPRLPLAYRDSSMAQRLRSLWTQDTAGHSKLDLVLVGHAHMLGPQHLVEALGKAGQDALLILPNLRLSASSPSPFIRLGKHMRAWH